MHSWRKTPALWDVGDTRYISVAFTWQLEEAARLEAEWTKGSVLIGGPAVGVPTECEGFEPVVFHNPAATFTTRGCPNQCRFCNVPILEPEFREITDFRPGPMVCDNNLLAATTRHIKRVVDKLKVFPYIDFNQGLEAGRFTPQIADLLAGLKCRVRFALDGWYAEQAVADAIDLCRERTTEDISVYVLIGYDDTPEDARARLEWVRARGIRPTPMRYQPLDAHERNCYVAPAWTEGELRRMTRYYSRLRWLEHIPYEDYQETGQGVLM